MVEIEPLAQGNLARELLSLIKLHYDYTNSAKARKILNNFNNLLADFSLVVPFEYRKFLAA